MRELNVGMIGYKFMGKAHSNAYALSLIHIYHGDGSINAKGFNAQHSINGNGWGERERLPPFLSAPVYRKTQSNGQAAVYLNRTTTIDRSRQGKGVSALGAKT